METTLQTAIVTKKQVDTSEHGNYVGKYVCYGNKDGGFCFGKIQEEIVVNTAWGLQPAFVLVNRMASNVGGLIRRFKERTTLRLSSIDIEKDIFDIDMEKNGLDAISDDMLFLMIMEANLDTIEGLPLGVVNYLGVNTVQIAKAKLSERLGVDEDGNNIGNIGV